MANTQRAALYVRVSTDDQLEFSPAAQTSALREYAKKNKLIILDECIFIDEGVSGRRAEKRPAFQTMVKAAKKKPRPFDVILVHKFDRFARSREDSVVYKSLLRKECGIKVVSITEQLEDDKFSIILESMLEAMAEYYSLNLADEVKKGMTEKAKRGGLQCSPSFGYRVEENTLVINPEESKIVKMIFEKFAYEDYAYLQLAKLVTDLGIKTHRGNSFENRTIEYILKNPVYIGKLRWNPTERTRRKYDHPDIITADAAHEHIISDHLFEMAQARAREIKAMYRPYQRPKAEHKHWLSGLLRCSSCGSSLIKSGQYFQCNNYVHGRCRVSHSLSIAKTENTIINRIKNDIKDIKNINYEVVYSDNSVVELELLRSQLKKVPDKLDRAKQAFLGEVDSLSEYKINKNLIQEDEAQLRESIHEIELRLKAKHSDKSFVIKLKSVYGLMSSDDVEPEKKYDIIWTVIKNIIFNKNANKLEIYYYSNL